MIRLNKEEEKVFDSYCKAALTGLLSNAAITTSVGLLSELNSTEKEVAPLLVSAAFEYALIVIEKRKIYI